MKAQDVADKLTARGYAVSNIKEPDSLGPGHVHVRDDIFVEVAAEGDAVCVVMIQPDGTVVYGRSRRRFAYVETDIAAVINQGWPRP